MNIRKMIEDVKSQIAVMEETVVVLERLEGLQSGMKRRGRPPLPKCEKRCGRPVHRGRCRRTSRRVTHGKA